jgi:hypothetical protein
MRTHVAFKDGHALIRRVKSVKNNKTAKPAAEGRTVNGEGFQSAPDPAADQDAAKR